MTRIEWAHASNGPGNAGAPLRRSLNAKSHCFDVMPPNLARGAGMTSSRYSGRSTAEYRNDVTHPRLEAPQQPMNGYVAGLMSYLVN